MEENSRKMVESILLSCPEKQELYKLIFTKNRENSVKLTSDQNKKMMHALMGNHPQFQNFIRKEKIEAYHLQKNECIEAIHPQNLDAITLNTVEPAHLITEGYSERRKLDGIIQKHKP
jgi:hypothetical protein